MADEEEVVAEEVPADGGPEEVPPSEPTPENDKPADQKADGETKNGGGLTDETIKRLNENRKQIQELNNAIKDLQCQDIFAYRNQRVSDLTDDVMLKMKSANCNFLRNFNNMWGMTQNMLDGLQLDRILSTELSHVPSSTVGFHSKITRSESFEKLSSKKLPRVIVCGTETSDTIPRIIVCDDKDTPLPQGECSTIQSNRNIANASSLSQSGYTSYGGRYC